jgi:hypothetical protein
MSDICNIHKPEMTGKQVAVFLSLTLTVEFFGKSKNSYSQGDFL